MGNGFSRSPSEGNKDTCKPFEDIEDKPSEDIEHVPSEDNKNMPFEDNEYSPSEDNEDEHSKDCGTALIQYLMKLFEKEDKPSKDIRYAGQMEVKEINKITLGRFIVKWVGNEGTEDTYESRALRELLQHAMSSLETRPKEIWTNAMLVIFDKEGRAFSICSGGATNKFLLYHDERNEPKLTPQTFF